MAKVIKDDLVRIKKEYGVERKTVNTDAKVAVFVEKRSSSTGSCIYYG